MMRQMMKQIMIELNKVKLYFQDEIRLKKGELKNENEMKMSKNYDLKK